MSLDTEVLGDVQTKAFQKDLERPSLYAVSNLSALHSAAHGDLVVPRIRLQLGNRAFYVAGPVAWNSLPLDIRSAPTFKNMLKTHLFSRSYFTD